MIYRGPQDYSLSYDLAPLPPPPSSVCKLDRRYKGRQRKKYNVLTGDGGWGEEPNHTTEKNPGPLSIIQYSLVVSYVVWGKHL